MTTSNTINQSAPNDTPISSRPYHRFYKKKSNIVDWLKSHKIKKYEITEDLIVNVQDDINLNNKKIPYIPVQFGKVSGNFLCENTGLKTLKGTPRLVVDKFSVNHNKLASLEFGPMEVRGDYCAAYNKIESLEFITPNIGGNILLSSNHLRNLEFAPAEVFSSFFCDRNDLTSLQGSPKKIAGDFRAEFNQLKSLKDGPEFIGRDYFLQHNQLKNLLHLPKEIGRTFAISGNTDLPKEYLDISLEDLKIKIEKEILSQHMDSNAEWAKTARSILKI